MVFAAEQKPGKQEGRKAGLRAARKLAGCRWKWAGKWAVGNLGISCVTTSLL